MEMNTIDTNGEVWKVKDMKDGLPIFVNESGVECSPVFDSNWWYGENAIYQALLTETLNDEWMDRFQNKEEVL